MKMTDNVKNLLYLCAYLRVTCKRGDSVVDNEMENKTLKRNINRPKGQKKLKIWIILIQIIGIEEK